MRLIKSFPEKLPKAVILLPTTTLLVVVVLLLVATASFDLHPQTLLWTRRATSPAPPPSPSPAVGECDLFAGEWVPDPGAPYYTNETCRTIHEQQNCMKHGRPDREFMRWRWKPAGCELPPFDPAAFLDLVRGRSMAFVGDSLSRNHMQSLMCLLSRVASPVEVKKTIIFFYPAYNFTIANYWSTFLVKAISTGPDEVLDGAFHLHVDKPDAKWTANISSFDYVILSAGQWFYRPIYMYEEDRLVSCHRCSNASIPKTTALGAYRIAFRSSLAFLNGLAGYKGTTFLRTYSPSHFENGTWNTGGDCVKTRPRRSVEIAVWDLEMRRAQVEEFRAAAEVGARRGLRHHLLDVTAPMLLRPDGHPSRYGHPASANVSTRDCVHWCMPGPVDSWSDLMLEIIKRDGLNQR